MTDHDCADPGLCGPCNQEAATAAYRGVELPTEPATVMRKTCPACGHNLTEEVAVRTTEADTSTADVQYADPGYQADKRKRYPLDTEKRVKSAWSYINKDENAAKYGKTQLNKVRGAIKAAMKKLGIKATEAVIDGKPTFGEIQDSVQDALKARMRAMSGTEYAWAWICDMSDTDVVYQAGTDDDLWQCSYAIGSDGSVTLGDPVEVERTYAPAGPEETNEPDDSMDMGEAQRDRIHGRVLESKGSDDTGGRIFRVRVIAYGDSKNGRRYRESVMREAVSLYEGAKAYDHHRDDQELISSTINGLIGYYRDVEATSDGIEADLYLLPSATHAAEALDASLAAQEQGLPPLIGVSHDVMATYRTVVEGGSRVAEATKIVKVNSADLVADPAAGGQATRMVAGGIEDPTGAVPAGQSTKESETVKVDDVLAALSEATDEQLAAVGLTKGEKTIEAVVETTTEAVGQAKDSFLGRLMIREAIETAELPAAATEAITTALPDRIVESDVDAQISAIKAGLGIVERAGLAPTATATVTKESQDKKVSALDAFFAADYKNGYRSFKEAFCDFTGKWPKSFDGDFNKTILRESIGFYDSAERSTESMSSTTWNLVLGDSITRRMVAEYAQPSLQTWRNIISSSIPVNDFRTQRIDRIGGYGTLPGVNQGQPYQPLTSPANEEVTYAITKRGGTEDVTLEMIANDDVRAIQRIPGKLGLAAAQTVYRFIWDMLDTNANIYDGTALFVGGHNNTAATALSQTNLSAARLAMRAQAAFGDTTNILSLIPKTLVVVNDLEEIAFQLCTSAVAIPATPAGPTDTPNIHQGLAPVVVDYWTSATKWITVADPTLCPTIEMGWYQGREDPELFTQSDPTVGSVFDADKVTYKIRHIYSGAVLDFRGFFRGNS